MGAKKAFVVFLALTFLVGTVGFAVAQEKKAPAAKPAVKTKTAEGTVKAVSDASIVVEGKDQKELTFVISGKVAESVKKLKAGDAVRVFYMEADGKMMASRVTSAKAPKKAAANPCAPAKK